jgi:thioredoxin
MEILNLETFKSKIYDFETNKEWKYSGSKPAIIDFYAEWCGPCHALAPVLEEVSEKYKGRVDIYKIDTEASPELASLFGIRGVPSLLFVPLEGEPSMSSGFIPTETFQLAIDDIFGIKP